MRANFAQATGILRHPAAFSDYRRGFGRGTLLIYVNSHRSARCVPVSARNRRAVDFRGTTIVMQARRYKTYAIDGVDASSIRRPSCIPTSAMNEAKIARPTAPREKGGQRLPDTAAYCTVAR